MHKCRWCGQRFETEADKISHEEYIISVGLVDSDIADGKYN